MVFCAGMRHTIFARLISAGMAASRRALLVISILVLPLVLAFSQNLSFGSRDAKPVPAWLYRSSIYEVWLNAFSPEGNLRGAIPGLKHIAELGATIVYLGPI